MIDISEPAIDQLIDELRSQPIHDEDQPSEHIRMSVIGMERLINRLVSLRTTLTMREATLAGTNSLGMIRIGELQKDIDELKSQLLDAQEEVGKWTIRFEDAERQWSATMSFMGELALKEGIIRGLKQAEEAALTATLPEGFNWGEDAMEQFNFGKERAAVAINELVTCPIPNQRDLALIDFVQQIHYETGGEDAEDILASFESRYKTNRQS